MHDIKSCCNKTKTFKFLSNKKNYCELIKNLSIKKKEKKRKRGCINATKKQTKNA